MIKEWGFRRFAWVGDCKQEKILNKYKSYEKKISNSAMSISFRSEFVLYSWNLDVGRIKEVKSSRLCCKCRQRDYTFDRNRLTALSNKPEPF